MSTAQGPGDPLTAPVAARVSNLNIANQLTILRLLLVPVFAVALLWDGGHSSGWRVAAWAIFAVASWTDRIDGQLARSRGLVTSFGKLADPIADKALIGTALIGLSILDLLPWWVTAIVVVRETLVTLLRFWVIRHGVIPASRGGKLKTLLQGLAIGLYVLPLSGWLGTARAVVMVLAVVVTVVTGIDYVARALTLRQTSDRAAMKRARRADLHKNPS
ncbi:MAG: CDP-diacylglycerol--glycerol-3-phosphate 3-phosphatidyltransferase [Mycobacteriales bacterium]